MYMYTLLKYYNIYDKSKVADGRHVESRYIAIFQWKKIIRFWWNLVVNTTPDLELGDNRRQ